MATSTRAACRIIAGVRFTKGADGVYRATLADGRGLWVFDAECPGDPTWRFGDVSPSGTDRNRGTRTRRDVAMIDALAWAEAQEAAMCAHYDGDTAGEAAADKKLAEIEAGAALADAEMQAKGYQAGPAVAAHRAELAQPAAAAEPEPFAPLASGGGFSIGDRVCRGNGHKVMTITNFRAGWGQNRGQVFAALNGGTLYDVRGLRLADARLAADPSRVGSGAAR